MFEEMLLWLDDIQLWSGIWGAIFGAVLGGVFTLLILMITINSQKSSAADEAERQAGVAQARLDQEAAIAAARLEQQALDSRTQLEQQAVQLANQLAGQREEKRESREIEAVSDLLMFVTSLVHDWPTDLSFVPELVRRCDRLTLNTSEVVSELWRQTKIDDKLGISRHPLARALTLSFALEQVSSIGLNRLEALYGGTIPKDFRRQIEAPEHLRFGLLTQLNFLSGYLLKWQSLNAGGKLAAFMLLEEWISKRIVRFLLTTEFFSHSCEPFEKRAGALTDRRGTMELHGIHLQLDGELPVQVSLVNGHGAPLLREGYAEMHRGLSAANHKKMDASPSLRAAWDESLVRANAHIPVPVP